MLSCSLPRTGIARQLGPLEKKLEQHCMRTYYPSSGTRGGTTSRSTYCSPGIKTSSRRYLLLRSPLRLGRCLGPPRAIVSCCFHLVVFFIVVDTGKTQPDDDVCWLVVRGLLVPEKKGAGEKKQSFDLVSICFTFFYSMPTLITCR